VAGAVAAAIDTPWVGLAAGVAVAAGLLLPWARALTAVAAAGALVAGAVSVVVAQVRTPVPESSNCPMSHPSAARLVWVAVVFLGADAVFEATRRVRARRHRDP
jgi:hypothetical protein